MRTSLPLLLAGCIFAGISTAQWTPLSANINSIVSMTEQGGDLFAASYPDGVFTSSNGGSSWSAVNTGLPMSGSNIFARSVGSSATNLFAGTHDGVYTSANGGTSWTAANGTLTASNQIYANKFFTFGAKTFAVFTGDIANGGGIYSTVTNGNSWTVSHVGMGSNVMALDIVQTGTTLLAATSAGLYVSTDNGANWNAVPTANYAIYAMGLAGPNLAAITAFGYQYINLTTFVVGNATGAPANPSAGEMIGYDGKVYANTMSNVGALRSIDNGQSYSAFNMGLTAIDQSSLNEFMATNTKLYVGALFDAYSVDGMTIGLEELSTGQVLVYPTHFDEFFQVELTATQLAGSVELIVLDIHGRTVISENLQASRTSVNAGHVAAGTYTYQVVSNEAGILSSGKLMAY